MHLLGPWSEPSELAGSGGGKASGLYALSACGLPVPDWAVIDTEVFEHVLAVWGLRGRADTLAAATGLDEARNSADALRTAIVDPSRPLPGDVRDLIGRAYATVGAGSVAVRSSMAVEDGASLSYAGQFDTFLNVTGETDLIDAVRRCWASAFSARSLSYAFAHGASNHDGVAVIVQRLVDAEISGVAFAVNPISGSTDETMISAVYGLGEGLVSGAVDADTHVVGTDGDIRDTIIGAKATRYRADPSGGSIESAVDAADRERPALNPPQIKELAVAVARITDHLAVPQDVEWAIADGELWFVQARPVTTGELTPPAGVPATAPVRDGVVLRGAGESVAPDAVRIWDNSNIIESFNGITSPLTFTTAADIYGRVYLGYATSLRVPRAQLAQVSAWTPVMLGTFHGRVYYNLVHWYRMVGIAPGHPLNRKVLEAALGVSEPLASAQAKSLRPFTFANPVSKAVSRLITTVTYLRRMADIDDVVADFLTEFYRVYDRFEKRDVDAMTGAAAFAAYREVEGDLVRRWGPLMVLDAILLTLTGTMFLLTKLFLPRAPEWFLYAVVGPGADVESAEPARAMAGLAQLAAGDPQVRAIIEQTAPTRCHRALVDGEHTVFLDAVDDYLERYGYRSLDELKLEVPDLREDPSSVFVMVRSAMAQAAGSVATSTTPSTLDTPNAQDTPNTQDTPDAQEYLDAHLHGIRRRIYDRVRDKTSRCAAHRERLRFARTRAFGMVKRLIRVMARDLVARGQLECFDDVFELTVEELRRCYSAGPGGSAGPAADLATLVRTRKAARLADSALMAPERFVTVGADLGDDALAAQGWVPVADVPCAPVGSVLTGTPSAAGVVEAFAHIVTEPHDVRGGVLVAYRTDPGWVAALPSASALVIERGSPLTHVAIVARELGVPTVVQVRDATSVLRSGMRIRVDGTQGIVTVLESAAADPGEGAPAEYSEVRHA